MSRLPSQLDPPRTLSASRLFPVRLSRSLVPQPTTPQRVLPALPASMVGFRHIPLPAHPSALLPRFPSYAFASHVQTTLQQELLAWKARPSAARGAPPPPSLLTFTPTPTYTLGRRQTEPLPESEAARLRAPLFLPPSGESEKWPALDAHSRREAAFFNPAVTHAPRGGLTTYHGPGQLVIWPVIDLHSPLHAHLSVRDYACLLEKTTIAALEKEWGLVGFTTDNPGVWVRSGASRNEERGGKPGGDERKIAALGVHLRRHVTGLGVAINYSTPVTGPEETNPWGRIVACGLGDRGVTSVCAELGIKNNTAQSALDRLAGTWQAEFIQRLKFRSNDVGSPRPFDIDQSMKDFRGSEAGDFLDAANPVADLGI
ncbi:hypothetical protein F4802DRAFT_273229 [Xylaria palmicola]|nr:hypothetical protein F4802DRAFT_273229 [Xylaria palmicola]